MPNFIVLKNGVHLDMINASGNLKALCTAINITGLPKFPMHVHQGLLLAKVGSAQYITFDCTDDHAHKIAEDIINEKRGDTVKKKRPALIPCLFRLPLLSTFTLEEPSYVV